MPIAPYVSIPSAKEKLVGVINSGTDQWAVALTDTVPPSDAFVSGTTDLPTGGGYTAGGNNVTTTSSGMNGNDYVLVLADPADFVASGGGFTYRYALLVDKTVNVVIGYWDYGSSQALAAGEKVTVDLDQTATVGVFKI